MKLEKFELLDENFDEYLKERNIEVVESSFYLTRSDVEGTIVDPGGVYLPRSFEGYIFNRRDFDILRENYAHEKSHGAFFENIDLGKDISRIDREIWEMEKNVFGKFAESQKFFQSGEETRLRGTKNGLPVFEIEEEKFEAYKGKVDELYEKISDNWNFIEAFAMHVSEDYLGELNLGRYPKKYKVAYEEERKDIEEILK